MVPKSELLFGVSAMRKMKSEAGRTLIRIKFKFISKLLCKLSQKFVHLPNNKKDSQNPRTIK